MPDASKPITSMPLLERVGQETEEEKKEEDVKPISKNLAKKMAKKNKGKSKEEVGAEETKDPAEEQKA